MIILFKYWFTLEIFTIIYHYCRNIGFIIEIISVKSQYHFYIKHICNEMSIIKKFWLCVGSISKEISLLEKKRDLLALRPKIFFYQYWKNINTPMLGDISCKYFDIIPKIQTISMQNSFVPRKITVKIKNIYHLAVIL